MSDLPKSLYHYTSYHGLDGVLKSKSLWCSKIQHMNDSEELRYGLGVLTRICHEEAADYFTNELISDITDRVSQANVFVCSLCESGDLLSQWRGYAGGSGVAIGFDFQKLSTIATPQGFHLLKCEYDLMKQEATTRTFVKEFISKLDDKTAPPQSAYSLALTFIERAATFKHSSFREENEWRLIGQRKYGQKTIFARPVQNGILPYTNFSLSTGNYMQYGKEVYKADYEDLCLSGIVIGPNPHQPLLLHSTATLGETHSAYIPQVNLSQIPFRQM